MLNICAAGGFVHVGMFCVCVCISTCGSVLHNSAPMSVGGTYFQLIECD